MPWLSLRPWGAGCCSSLLGLRELAMEEVSSSARGAPETPNQDSFSMEAAPWSCRRDARPGDAPVPRAGGPQAVSVQKPPRDGCSDIPSLLQSRSRAPSQGPWPAGAAALPCWGHSSSQGGLVGYRGGCQLPPAESFPRMLLGKHPPAQLRHGDISVCGGWSGILEFPEVK